MSQAINTHSQAIELLERFAHCILRDCKNKDEMSTVKDLAPYITYFSQAIELNNSSDQIFDKFIDMIESAPEELDSENVLKEFNNEIKKVKEQLSANKCERYDNFMELISQYSLDDCDHDEVETIAQNINKIDPITKLPIVEPVKNKICGHVYEKNSILQLILQNPKTRCPIPGCVASDYVKKQDLMVDNVLKRILSSHSSGNIQKRIKLDE